MNLGPAPSDEEILAAIDEWIDALARGDYQAAYDLTEHDLYHAWTPELMCVVIEGYGLPEPRRDGKVFHVTDRHLAKGKRWYREVQREELPADLLAEVWYDLPLNGEWSDLTATFHIVQKSGGCAIVLQEIHVF